MALTLGIVGGGQLARMMIAPAVELGVQVRVLAEQPGMSAEIAARSPFFRAQVASRMISLVGIEVQR